MSINDDEQLVELKEWGQRNSKTIVTGGLLVLVLVFGWQIWHKYQSSQSQGASALYQQLLEATFILDGRPDVARVADLANRLKSEYAGTAYAQFGGLFVAKAAVDNGKLDDAAAELKTIADNPKNRILGEVARQRLAQVLAAQGKVDDALQLLEGDSKKAFLASHEELRGDLLVQQGHTDDARVAYEKAIAAPSGEAAVSSLRIKLDDLAKGDA